MNTNLFNTQQLDKEIDYALDEIETEVFYRTGWPCDEKFRSYIESVLLNMFKTVSDE